MDIDNLEEMSAPQKNNTLTYVIIGAAIICCILISIVASLGLAYYQYSTGQSGTSGGTAGGTSSTGGTGGTGGAGGTGGTGGTGAGGAGPPNPAGPFGSFPNAGTGTLMYNTAFNLVNTGTNKSLGLCAGVSDPACSPTNKWNVVVMDTYNSTVGKFAFRQSPIDTGAPSGTIPVKYGDTIQIQELNTGQYLTVCGNTNEGVCGNNVVTQLYYAQPAGAWYIVPNPTHPIGTQVQVGDLVEISSGGNIYNLLSACGTYGATGCGTNVSIRTDNQAGATYMNAVLWKITVPV
jgi:hypothetical protein